MKAVWPPPDVVREGFELPRFIRLRLDRFPRGVDNFHIDVALGPALGGAAAAYVAALVRESAQRLWKEPVPAFSEGVADNFREILQEHHRAVVKVARAINRLERVQLFQLSVIKLFMDLIDTELSSLRLQLEDARTHPERQLSGQSLQLHQHAVVLGRHAGHVRYRVASHLMREYMRLEQGAMRNLRKSVLGLPWPIPEAMLDNPILQLDGTGSARDFCRIYPLLLYDEQTACKLNRCILEILAAWLPDSVVPAAPQAPAGPVPVPAGWPARGGAGSLEVDRWVRGLFGQKELGDGSSNWLDRPENAIALFGGSEADWPQPGPWRHPGIARLQRDLTKRLASRLARAGLMRGVTASYELAAVYPLAGLVDAELLVFDYLKGSINRREAMRRLRAVEGVTDAAASLRRIEELRKDFRRSTAAGRPQILARLAGDFLRLRRDMKLAWRAFSGMDSLRLVVDESELHSSLNNSTLQVFCREEVVANTRGSVVGHVILQADVRGVAEVTVQMRRRKLDPAAHFSRHFFGPIKRLLEQFGARKVAVEGDALTLSLLEYGGEYAECLAVARGCCVATGLVQLLDTMNAEHERIGLPRVELGLGVAYAGEAPTYLYDHARKVTISPAIARARLLSACHPLLRETCSLPGGRGLCVASPVRRSSVDGQIGEELVRYNVNGIELDAAAYAQLNTEISLRRLSRRGEHPATFFAGGCTDAKGESHWLLVRQRNVKLWLGGRLLEAEEDGRRYYEVISDSKLIGRVREKLSGEQALDNS
jgi:hypothetical protein